MRLWRWLAVAGITALMGGPAGYFFMTREPAAPVARVQITSGILAWDYVLCDPYKIPDCPALPHYFKIYRGVSASELKPIDTVTYMSDRLAEFPLRYRLDGAPGDGGVWGVSAYNLYYGESGIVTTDGGAPPPPPPTESPDNTEIVAPTGQLVDASLAVWTWGNPNYQGYYVLRNGAPAAGGWGSRLLYYMKGVYLLNGYGDWTLWDNTGWRYIGRDPRSTDPINDIEAPAVSIVTVRRSGNSPNFTVTAAITDNIGVVRADFLVDGFVQATLAGPPWTAGLRISTRGSHQIQVAAYDAAGNVGQAVQTVVR